MKTLSDLLVCGFPFVRDFFSLKLWQFLFEIKISYGRCLSFATMKSRMLQTTFKQQLSVQITKIYTQLLSITVSI